LSVRARKELQDAQKEFKHLGRGKEDPTTCSTLPGMILKVQRFFW
jgi:hypothetical protein